MIEDAKTIFKDIKIGFDIIKARKDVSANKELLSELEGLQSKLIAANNFILSYQEKIDSLTNAKNESDRTIVELNAFNHTLSQYAPYTLNSGRVVYALKNSSGDRKEPHYLCSNCVGNSMIHFLQATPIKKIMVCEHCKDNVWIKW